MRKVQVIASIAERLGPLARARRGRGRSASVRNVIDTGGVDGIMEESDLVRHVLRPMGASRTSPLMVQIGANDGKFEYAKENGQDWSAILIEPLPDAFASLKANYRNHRNPLVFLKCAIASGLGYGRLSVSGPEGKTSSLLRLPGMTIDDFVSVLCLRWTDMCGLLDVKNVDFVKIDAEGMDAEIVLSILRCGIRGLVPDVIFYESKHTSSGQLGECEAALREGGYRLFRSGLNRQGSYMDLLAVRNIDYRTV